jgi:hypothetical protein
MVQRVDIHFYDSPPISVKTRLPEYAPAAALLEQGDPDWLAALEEALLAVLNGAQETLAEATETLSVQADLRTAQVWAASARYFRTVPGSPFLREEPLTNCRGRLPTLELYEYLCRWSVERRKLLKKEAGQGLTLSGQGEVWLVDRLRRATPYRNVLCKAFCGSTDFAFDSALDYVEEHRESSPAFAFRREDSYAVIDLQPTAIGGRGLDFQETRWCRGVLTLPLDRDEHNEPRFTEAHGEQILRFALRHRAADTLLVVGEQFSPVAAFLVGALGGDASPYYPPALCPRGPEDPISRAMARAWARMRSEGGTAPNP